MTTSGTYAFSPPNADLILEAFERIGKRSNQLDGNTLRSATRSAGFVCAKWSNLGINLWEVSQVQISLVQGTATYLLNQNVVQALDVFITQSGVDRNLYPIGRSDYASIPNKTQQGFPNAYWFVRTTTPQLTLWNVPDGNGPYVMNVNVMTRQQDFGATMAQTADLPYRFLDAFCADLAAQLAVKFAPERFQMLEMVAEKSLREARAEDRELAPISITPDTSSYWD